jgi:REP element-mobilizing transposase RayT
MSHSFTHLVYHIAFATKFRRPCIEEALEGDLHALLRGLVGEQKGVALAVNGMPEHIHILASLSPSRAVSDVVGAVKAESSFWLAKSVPGFAWQTGYGAFTVSRSNEDTVRCYIQDQKKHHANRTYLDEFRALLRKHGLPPPSEDHPDIDD